MNAPEKAALQGDIEEQMQATLAMPLYAGG